MPFIVLLHHFEAERYREYIPERSTCQLLSCRDTADPGQCCLLKARAELCISCTILWHLRMALCLHTAPVKRCSQMTKALWDMKWGTVWKPPNAVLGMIWSLARQSELVQPGESCLTTELLWKFLQNALLCTSTRWVGFSHIKSAIP